MSSTELEKALLEAFKGTDYAIKGHGHFNVGTLKEAFTHIDNETFADAYGNGHIINDFEEKLAGMLGKEKAIFYPSGTMAQQIALRIRCDEKEIYRVAYHPYCHLEIYEEDGLKELHAIETKLLGDKNRVFTLEDLKQVREPLAALLIELPQRSIGGQLPSWDELVEICSYCKEKGIYTHLDGARVWEVLPYYKKSLEEIASLFDSVYVSFYKGIGAVAGAILAGSADFMEKARVWKRRYGGDIISLYPYVVTADYYLEQRLSKMSQYYEGAKEIAAYFNGLNHVRTLPEIPVSNMFHVYMELDYEQAIKALIDTMDTYGIGITAHLTDTTEGGLFELHVGDAYDKVPKDRMKEAFAYLKEKL